MTVLFVTHSIAEAVLLSDRVVVLSPRPGRVQTIITVDLPRPRALSVRSHPRFIELCESGLAELERGFQ
jgi:NitT/TauT family transport system ATP-binding protein